jgi:excisionase family DNA binding protein
MEDTKTTWMTVTDAAKLLQVSSQTIRRRIKSGEYNARMEGGQYLVSQADVEQDASSPSNILATDVASLQIQVKSLRDKNQSLREQVLELEIEKVRGEGAREQIHILEERIREYGTNQSQWEKARTESVELKSKLVRLEIENAALEERNQLLHGRVEQLEQEKENMLELRERLTELEKGNAELAERNELFQQNVRSLEEDKAYLQERIVVLETQVTTLTPRALPKPSLIDRFKGLFGRAPD